MQRPYQPSTHRPWSEAEGAIDRQRLLQDLELHKRNLAESERGREDLRRENEALRGKLAEQQERVLQWDAQIRNLKEQYEALRGPDANLDRCDELAQSCRDVVGRCAELLDLFSRKCGAETEPAGRILPDGKPPAKENGRGKEEEET